MGSAWIYAKYIYFIIDAPGIAILTAGLALFARNARLVSDYSHKYHAYIWVHFNNNGACCWICNEENKLLQVHLSMDAKNLTQSIFRNYIMPTMYPIGSTIRDAINEAFYESRKYLVEPAIL